MKKLIITADDFGLCPEVNQAVIKGHINGVLTCASLMVTGEAADEAVALARKTPSLKVGLHLVLVDGFSVLSHKEIPDLVDVNRRFRSHIVLSGLRYFFSRRIKAQIAAECEAQINKFMDMGLSIDHINSHAHLHIHPSISEILLSLIARYNIPAVRLPRPAGRPPNLNAAVMTAAMAPWVSRLKRRLVGRGIPHNQEIFGLYETGAMGKKAWLQIIPRIREGISEVYCHPAVRKSATLMQRMPSYRNTEEFDALISPVIKAKLDLLNIIRTSFSEIT